MPKWCSMAEVHPVPDRRPGRFRTTLLETPALSDLLTLGTMACRSPAGCVALRRGNGWEALTYGLPERLNLEADQLFEAVADSVLPLRFTNLAYDLADSPLIQHPYRFEWAIGANLRDRTGEPIGVALVFDRVIHAVDGGEEQALLAMGRRLVAALAPKRRPAESPTPRLVVEESREALTPRQVIRSEAHPLLRTSEVAAQFNVTDRTVIHWVNAGKLPALRTVGGHLRFRRDDIWALLVSGQRGHDHPEQTP